MKAIWKNKIIAESTSTITVEGNHYFPPDSVNFKYLQASTSHSSCPWKGEASYFDVVINGFSNTDAAWYYPDPKKEALKIKGYLAFWKGIKIEK